MRKLAFFASCLLLAVAAHLQLVGAAQAQTGYYRIQAGDQLSVTVLEDPNMNRTVLVRPDGRITLPIAGSVRAEGLSPERLEQVLQQRFARGFEITPTVTVALRFIASAKDAAVEAADLVTIYFLGQVGKPGPLVLEEPISILKALALVGGPGRFADLNDIQIRRSADPEEPGGAVGPEEIMIFNYDLIEDGDPAQANIMLQDGDVVVVPERGLFN